MKKKILLMMAALLCLTTVLVVSSNTANAESIALKGNYLYDRQGKKGYADGQAGFDNYGSYFSKKNKYVMIPSTSVAFKKINGELE